ncbi:MAG: efflux RND transporter periplasmic adaptor subunit [Ignavibacteriales bacterium]|jgi:RND family efflux transporter MFP subunit|nr:efflux RND transporter periplasmic adaptor subunit [Ignavibacteriales bacterium]MBK8662332.1 efflux RND transporter periplasmic adaptor subunit [Ignavibacteriales bacterium]MCC6638812.1 efflux RND transporter periplasmic adaptor subunit [Ignavibacteriaceae bacterium]
MSEKEMDLSSLKIDRAQRKNPETRGKYIKTGIIVLLFAAIAYTLFYFFGDIFDPPLEVKMTTAIMQTPTESEALLTGNGYVVAQRKASIASKAMGRLVYLKVVEGDRVRKGEVIGRLEDTDILAQIAQAEANVKLAETDLREAENNYKRVKQLFDKSVATEMEVDAAETRLKRVVAGIELARMQIKTLKVDLENTLIRAPFDGTVLTKNAEVGEVVSPLSGGANSRAAVVTIADMNSLQVEADVAEANIDKVQMNMECIIYLDAYPDNGYPGFVDKIVPTADRSKATVLVKIGFKGLDNKVLPEMRARVSFMAEEVKVTNEKSFLAVPVTAIVTKGDKKYVLKVSDDKIVEVPVTLGKDYGITVEIKTGLAEGDKVVEKPGKELVPGLKVKIKQ